jgi:beta-glucosidase
MKEAEAKRGPSKNPLAFLGGKEPVEEMPVSKALAAKMADKNDIALITIGRNAGEGRDRTATEGDFYLTATEKEMIKNVSEAFHAKGKKAVIVLNVAGVVEVASWRDMPDAILLAWQPGQEGGNSVIDVLSGKVNPSGKLAVTFPMSYADAPTAKNFPGVPEASDVVDNAADLSGFSFMRRMPWQITYEEDIYVGYRYYTTFNVPVAYEFGYGLSYTSFEYSNLKLSSSDFNGELTATVEVKNIGSVAGREVVQVYVSAPNGKLEKPEEALVAFGKTKLLQPGEAETLSFKIKTKDIASFDEATSSGLPNRVIILCLLALHRWPSNNRRRLR